MWSNGLEARKYHGIWESRTAQISPNNMTDVVLPSPFKNKHFQKPVAQELEISAAVQSKPQLTRHIRKTIERLIFFSVDYPSIVFPPE